MLTAADECQACLPGMYCDRPGLVTPRGDCEVGYFCGGGSTSATPYRDEGSYGGESCVDATNASTNGLCPPGHYCPAGSRAPARCPIGTFSTSPGLGALSECSACTAGYVCGKEAQTAVSERSESDPSV